MTHGIQLFSTSVNTTLKPPTAPNKENHHPNGMTGRKVSFSGSGPMSPTTIRGSGRRRETGESYPFPPTPGLGRDEQRAPSPPPSLTRRRTDFTKSADREGDEGKSTAGLFGSLKRHTLNPLATGLGTPTSSWITAPQSAGLSPMGSFGNFGMNPSSGATDKSRGLGSGRAESRFKNLLSRDSGDDMGNRPAESKSGASGLARVNEYESWRPRQRPAGTNDSRTDGLEELRPSGSAALAADADVSPPAHRAGTGRAFGTPSRSTSCNEYGLGAFGMTADHAPDGADSGFLPGGPQSPDTNPFKSPEQFIGNRAVDEHDGEASSIPGLGGFGADAQHQQHLSGLGGLGALSNRGRGVGPAGPDSDRSQNSSAGPGRTIPGLGGLGQLSGVSGASGWPISQPSHGTPLRSAAGLSTAFGGGIFATSMGGGDMQSSGLAGLGGPGVFGSQHGNGTGSGRGSSMFPQGMQDQVRLGELERGSSAFGGNHDDDSSLDPSGSQFPAAGQASSSSSHNTSSLPPPPQQRTMVMPDRMRWIYCDPQGQTQGPWTGLEMHDWYKAGFFSPELLVKKYEDPDYEPLAQLIRRIGNSREPFLVPQIGIPHGAPASTGPHAWSGVAGAGSSGPGPVGGSTGAAAPINSAQPPFASSFPSFGTTLTAEQQNALERRKQEEQYLMARQKEHLAQQQIVQRMQQHPPSLAPHPGMSGLLPGVTSAPLHHHGSAQSLHSQPSFGTLASPAAHGFQPSQLPLSQGGGPPSGFLDAAFRGSHVPSGALGVIGGGVDAGGQLREDEMSGLMDRLHLGVRGAAAVGGGQFSASGQPFASPHATATGLSAESLMPSGEQQQQQHEKQVRQMIQDRAWLQEQLQQQQEPPASTERLHQFHSLQGQIPNLATVDARLQPAIGKIAAAELKGEGTAGAPMSLTEQVQNAPTPFAPPPSQSPLPAPAAQRTGRQSVADQLQTEQGDISDTTTSCVDAPATVAVTVAPWAKESAELSKGPSLKEIQEVEAKKAAEAEELASAARRAAAHREMEAQAQAAQAASVAAAASSGSGLPASASWAASGASPAAKPPTPGQSAWAKAAQKNVATAAGPVKSMAQIQKEEEARKRRVAGQAQISGGSGGAAAAAASSTAAVVKSYANLAGKMSPAANAASAWTTVGAGGKTKAPVAAPVSASPVSGRAGPAQTTAKKASTRNATGGVSGGGPVNAQEEFRKWAVGELKSELGKGYSGELWCSSLFDISH